MANSSIDTILTGVQILVGLFTLGGLIFYMGKHSARVDRVETDVVEIRDTADRIDYRVGKLEQLASVLEERSGHRKKEQPYER